MVFVHLEVKVDEDLGFLLFDILYGFVQLELFRSANATSEWESTRLVIIACWGMSNSKRAAGASRAFRMSPIHDFTGILMACLTEPVGSTAEVYCNVAAEHAFPVDGAGTVHFACV